MTAAQNLSTTSATRYAKQLQVSRQLIHALVRVGALPDAIPHAGSYHLDSTGLPDRDGLIALARGTYRDQLAQAQRAVRKLASEVEAVDFDLQEALDAGTNPVTELGVDVSAAAQRDNPLTAAPRELSRLLLQAFQLRDLLQDEDRLRRADSERPKGTRW